MFENKFTTFKSTGLRSHGSFTLHSEVIRRKDVDYLASTVKTHTVLKYKINNYFVLRILLIWEI